MNKHKITSIILISAMLSESLPVVNAYDSVDSDNLNVASESTNLQYTEDIEENLNDDILDDGEAIDNNSEDIENSKDSKLEDLNSEDLNSDANNNDINNGVSIIPSLENDAVNSEAIIEDLECEVNININQDTELNEEVISESVDDLESENINMIASNVLEITLTDGEFVPDLTGNPDGYDTIRVTTTGNKKLVSTDYNRLRESLIPNVDLSQAKSDSIPAGAFSNATHLTSFLFPQGIKSIDSASNSTYGAFIGCMNLKGDLVIPDGVITIGDYAFTNCSGLTGDLIIPNSVTTIGSYAFNGCSGFDGKLVLPKNLEIIGAFAFYRCSGFTGELKIPDFVTHIGSTAFELCSGFTGNLVIPESVEFVGSSSFRRCTGITGYVTIPKSVTTLDSYVFRYSSNIEKFILSVDESCSGSNYRKSIYDNLVASNLPSSDKIIEVPYDFDITKTWINNLSPDKVKKPILNTEEISFYGNKSLSVSLHIPTPYNEQDIVVLKDGEEYELPAKTHDGKHIFNDDGLYSIKVKTLAGTISNIDFEVVASVNKPDINYKDNMVTILDNGNNLGLTTDRIEYRINGGEWKTYSDSFRVPDEFVNGIDDIKVEARVIVKDKVSKVTECSLTIPKAQIIVDNIEITEGDEFNERDFVSATDIDGSDISGIVTVEYSDVKTDTPGEYTVIYRVEGSNGYVTEKEITVKVNPIIINKPSIKYENNLISIVDNGSNSNNNAVTVEYRINGGEWKTYSGEFRIPDEFVDGVDVTKIEARTVVGQYISDISEANLTISKAEIKTNDVEITEGDNFNELDYATATDIDGTDISNKVTVEYSNVKLDTPGEYTVIYKVEASNGYFTEKEIKVTVVKKKLPPVILAEEIVLEKGEKFDPLDFIIVTDSDGNYLDKSNVEIIENTVNLSEPGKYRITYKMVDNNGLSTTKTITVTVEEPDVDNENSNENSGNNISDNNKNNNGEANKNKIPNTGGVAPLLNLANIISFIGGYIVINKRKKN